MKCARCGYDADAKVIASWSFVVDIDPPSLNERVYNEGSSRWRYAKLRNTWSNAMMVARVNRGVPVARARRRVTMTRLYSGRQQRRDRDNNAGGMKVCVDAMVTVGLLRDDNEQWSEIYYDQFRGDLHGLRVLIEEFADG